MPNLYEHRARLAKAIARAASEHGTNNSFGLTELHDLYGGPPAMIAGRLVRMNSDWSWLCNELRPMRLNFSNRRLWVLDPLHGAQGD